MLRLLVVVLFVVVFASLSLVTLRGSLGRRGRRGARMRRRRRGRTDELELLVPGISLSEVVIGSIAAHVSKVMYRAP